MEQGKLYKRLFENRQTGDYDDWAIIEESDVMPYLEPAGKFIATIEELIKNK
jgi:uncharacterized protein (UPF0332 family)